MSLTSSLSKSNGTIITDEICEICFRYCLGFDTFVLIYLLFSFLVSLCSLIVIPKLKGLIQLTSVYKYRKYYS